MKRKIIPMILIFAAACLALAACMNTGSGNVGNTPEPTADYAPNGAQGDGGAQNGNGAAGLTNGGNAGGTGGNGTGNGVTGGTGTGGGTGTAGNAGASGNTAATSNGALNPFDWANGAADIEKAIAQLSEISEARVVVTNSTALVGVRFDGAYKGEITERIRQMVAAEVLKADPNIQTVAVTASEEDVKRVYALSEQIRAGRTADELSADINAIVRNATTLR